MSSWALGVRWDAGVLEAEANTNRRHVHSLTQDHNSALAVRPAIWFGMAAERAGLDFRLMLYRLEEITSLLEREAGAMSDAAADLREIQGSMQRLRDYAANRDFRIDDSGTVRSLAGFPQLLDPRRVGWRLRIDASEAVVEFRLLGLDTDLAFKLGSLVFADLADAAHQGLIDGYNRSSAADTDTSMAFNEWLIDVAEVLSPGDVAWLRAFGEGPSSFLGELGRQPRWVQELLYTGNLPSPAELLGHTAFLGGRLEGASRGSTLFDDGTAYVPQLRPQDSGPLSPTGTDIPPRDMSDLMRRMTEVYDYSRQDDPTDHAGVEVTVVGEPPRFIVTIPGTTVPLDSHQGWHGDPEGTDWPANLKAIGMGDSAAIASSMAAIDLAIREYEAAHGPVERPNILLTGHSQGGIIAANIAADPQFTARYQVDGVVTAGSPVNTIPVNHDVPVMNFSTPADVVPKLDLGGVQPQPNVQEVYLTDQWHDPLTSHEPGNYELGVSSALQRDPEVWQLNEELAPYFNHTEGTRYVYDIGRSN